MPVFSPPSSPRPPWQTRNGVYALLLLLAALLSPHMAFPSGTAPLYWLPPGIALGALLRHGRQVLPGILPGLCGAHLLAGLPWPTALGMGLLDSGVVALIATLMSQCNFDPYLRQRRDSWLLLGLGTLLGSLLIALGQHLLFASSLDLFGNQAYHLPLGLLLGALPVLAYSRPKLRQLQVRRVLADWSLSLGVPLSMLCAALLFLPHSRYLPEGLLPVLGLLWMTWFILNRGQGSAATALTLSALVLGWLLALLPAEQIWHMEGIWALLLAMGVLACAVSPLLAELRSRDKRVRLALEGTQTGIWELNIKSGNILFSPGWLEHLGYPEAPGGLSRPAWEKLIHPEDLGSTQQALQEYLQGQTFTFRQEFRLKSGHGQQIWLIARGHVSERDCNGRPLQMVGTLVDITAPKATQQYLQLLERALHSARDAVAILEFHNPEYPIRFTNPALTRITGYAPEQLLGNPLFFFRPREGGSAAALIETALLSGEAACGQTWVERLDHSGFWSQYSISPVQDAQGRVSHCIAIFSDVSNEVRIRQHLKERDELLRKLSEQVPGLIFQYQVPLQGRPFFPYASDGLRQLFGLEPGPLQLDARHFFATLHPQDRGKVEAGLNACQERQQLWHDEFRVLLEGREYWRAGQAVPEYLANGDVLWHGYITDISEQVRLVTALGESEARFRAIANATPMLIWQANPEHHCTWCNQAWFDFTGEYAYLAAHHTWMDYLHPDDRPECQALLQAQSSQRQSFRQECRIRHRDGQWRWIINHAVPRLSEQGEFLGYIGACMDIDEQKRVELALRQSQEELRRMTLREEELLEQERKRIASQVHDELGQLLTALKMGLSALRLRFQHIPGLEEQIRNLNELNTRSFQVVRQVTSHLRPQALDHGLRAALEWLAQATTQNTGLLVRADCPETTCQPPEAVSTALFRLAQEGVTNVLKHARARQAKIRLSCRHGCLILTLQDDGIGFLPDSCTTSSGYGLLGMRERAQALGGNFRIHSMPGQGTTLQLSIPLEVSHDCNSCPCCR